MKMVTELLEETKKKIGYIMDNVAPEYVDLCYEAIDHINDAMTAMEAPPWVTPGQYLDQTREMYPDMAPVWSTSKHAIAEKPTKYNKLHWFLDKYSEAGDHEVILCAYNHLEPPPDDWRPGKEAEHERDNT
jgi:hypothetical protein